ncbi:hypothetical protein ACFQ0K_10735 [Nocardioides caeni]|uniref:Uncharacterized protein n=1 Tax=Nocardioides caeni TaxID=574700 RepID=A0A4S8N284_9ACTN|nr:hypothetical protein [Nocardioides caeni]THV09885.1 hypothetical protein E9934_15260 [Nocardioides caeni]
MSETPAEDRPADTSTEPGYDERDAERVAERSELLPEEQEVGSADPEAQAEAILEESDDRVEHPEETRLESTQTPDPADD